MTYQTGRSGWNERGKPDTVWSQLEYVRLQDRKRKEDEFKELGYKALDLLDSVNYVRLVDQMPDWVTITEAIEWMQEIVKAGDLLQGYCRHSGLEYHHANNPAGGDLIEYISCSDCGRSLLCMNLA